MPKLPTFWLRVPLLLWLLIATSTVAEAGDQVVTLPSGKKAVLHDDHTWEYVGGGPVYDFDFSTLSPTSLPTFLRGGIPADVRVQKTAVEMYLQGWRYTMPRPKSAQAAWGNRDRRTTWFYGYWYNAQRDEVSATDPTLKQDGRYVGDRQDKRGYWRNGGSPPSPTVLEWLLSKSGGVKP